MTASKTKSFKAVLESAGESLNWVSSAIPPYWVTVKVPFDIAKAWPELSDRRVRGTINGFAFRTSLFRDKSTGTYMLLVNKNMRAGAKAGPGQSVQIALEPDLEKPNFEMPVEFERELRGARGLRKYFESLAPSLRKGFVYFINQAKSPETRRKRSERMAEALYLAMEGEQDPPPILRAAFQRQPLVEAGWRAMTPIKRRNHLLGIFYRQTARGREQRAQQAVEDALSVARRKSGRSSLSM